VAGGEQLLAGARRAAFPFTGEVVRMAGAGAAVRASMPAGPGDAPVPGAWPCVDGEQDGVDAAGRAPGDAVVAEGTVHGGRRRPAPRSEKEEEERPGVCQRRLARRSRFALPEETTYASPWHSADCRQSLTFEARGSAREGAQPTKVKRAEQLGTAVASRARAPRILV
jgi:hypothetical protein